MKPILLEIFLSTENYMRSQSKLITMVAPL